MAKILTVALLSSFSLIAVFANATPKALINVSVQPARMKVVPETLSAYGHIEAIHQVQLSFEVSGHINAILKKTGRVKQGQLIMTLNDDVDQAELKSLNATLALDQSNFERSRKLKAFGGISEAALEAAEAKVKKDQAEVEKQKALIDKKKMLAPFDGVLGDLKYSKGAYVNAGEAVLSLVQEAPLKVRYSIPENYKKQVEIGQAVSVDYDKQRYPGLVNFISPQVNTDSGTLTVEAKVPNKNYTLTPGQFVNVIQVLDPERKLLVVPSVAVMSDILGQYVFIVQNGTAHKSYVKTGVVSAQDVQIVKGVGPGDKV